MWRHDFHRISKIYRSKSITYSKSFSPEQFDISIIEIGPQGKILLKKYIGVQILWNKVYRVAQKSKLLSRIIINFIKSH